MNRRSWAVIMVILGIASVPAGIALAEDVPSYSRPDGAEQVLRAKDLPFRLWYDKDKWKVAPQRSQLRLLARAVHKDGNVSGAFAYRDDDETADEIRERAVGELETAFASHEVAGFSRRTVNGLDILFMRASATTEDGTKVIVRNYYWQGPEGVADYGLVANQDMFERYRDDIHDLLNGFALKNGADADYDWSEASS